MSVTTEEIELLAQTHDLVRFTLGMKAPEHDLTAAALRSLAAERDAMRAKVERPESGVSYETFVSAMQIVTVERDALQAEKVNLQDDLASVERERAHQHGRADRNAAEYAREQKKREQLQAENARLREALAECNIWLTAAIEYKDWMWDGDQKEAAIFARDQARAALGETQ